MSHSVVLMTDNFAVVAFLNKQQAPLLTLWWWWWRAGDSEGGSVMADQGADDASFIFTFLAFALFRAFERLLFRCFFACGIIVSN